MTFDSIIVSKYPVCGRLLDPSSLKYTEASVSSYFECHSCFCGARFSVELSIDSLEPQDDRPALRPDTRSDV